MKITNLYGLPQSVFEALERKEYSRGEADISVTELIDSPRVRTLKNIHADKLTIDAEALLPSFLGTCFHKGLESGTKTGTPERRLDTLEQGWILSGGMDHYHDGVLTDYKTATCWKTKLDCPDGRIEDFENQLNVYAHILRKHGVSVQALKIFILFKDWNKRGANDAKKRDQIFEPYVQGGYPERSWLHFEMKLWSEDAASAYVTNRVLAHQGAEKSLPPCTSKEMWRGNRCAGYCAVAPFCDQYNKVKQTGLMAPLPEEQP